MHRPQPDETTRPACSKIGSGRQAMQEYRSKGSAPFNQNRPYGPQPYATYENFDQKTAGKLKLVDIVQRFISCRFFIPESLHNFSYDMLMRNDVWNVLHRSNTFKDGTDYSTIVFSALLFLQRVSDRMSFSMLYLKSERAQTNHYIFKLELFLSALMISHRYHCDSTPSAKSWSRVTGNFFGISDINDMLRRMSTFLEFDFKIPVAKLTTFRELVEDNFSKELPFDFDSHYHAYVPTLVSDLSNSGAFGSLERHWESNPEDELVEKFIPPDNYDLSPDICQ